MNKADLDIVRGTELNSATSIALGVPRTSTTGAVIYADALRLIAITAVVLNHFAAVTGVTFKGRTHSFAWIGIWGVDCFFVLTGFLLSARFFEAILGRRTFPSLREYSLRRFMRIYPLYFVALVVSIIAAIAAGERPSAADILAHVTLTHSLFPQYISQFNGPLWTMCIDAQFYIALPLGALALATLARGRSYPQRLRLIWASLALIVAISVFQRFVALSMTMPHHLDWDHMSVASRNLIGMGANFAIGAGLALLSICRPVPSRSKGWYGCSIALGILLLIGLARLPLASPNQTAILYSNTFTDLIGGCSAGALLYGALRGNFRWLTKALGSRFVLHGAQLAYAIYLFHYLIIERAKSVYSVNLASPIAAVVFTIVVFPMILLVAEFAYRFIELPGLRQRDKHREVVPVLP